MKFFIDNGVSKSFFDRYEELSISPHHIHKTKAEQKYAIFTLAWCISSVLAEHDVSISGSVVNRLEGLAQRCKDEIF
jgi:hypothetical protein